MNHALASILIFLSVILLSLSSFASPILWATGCFSFKASDIISVSYQKETGEITLYRAWGIDHNPRYERFFTKSYSGRTFEPTIFRSHYGPGATELTVIFESKNTIKVSQNNRQTEYLCDYYSFDRK